MWMNYTRVCLHFIKMFMQKRGVTRGCNNDFRHSFVGMVMLSLSTKNSSVFTLRRNTPIVADTWDISRARFGFIGQARARSWGHITISLPESNLESINVVVTFESVVEILVCDHSNESYWTVLLSDIVCFLTILQNETRFFRSSVLNLALLGVKGLTLVTISRTPYLSPSLICIAILPML